MHRPDVGGAVLVALAGGLWLMTALGTLTIEPFFALPALAVTGVLVHRVARGRSGWSALAGLPTGASVLPLWYAYLVIGHPGVDVRASGEGLPTLSALLALAAVPVLVTAAILAGLWAAGVR